LLGRKRTLIKLSFRNTQDLIAVRNVLRPAADINRKKMENTGAFEEVQGYFINLTLRLTETSNQPFEKSERITTKNGQDVLENILELREYDVQYYVRVAIDCGTVFYLILDLRVGLWYSVKAIQGMIHIKTCPEKITRADPIIFAFDIETTKLPLKFPDSSFDSIMMISYMVDGQGFLITNREIVSQDIDDFDYTPKPEFEGPFVIFNEDDEV